MRDPGRIESVLYVVRRLWEQHPDQRLGQLLINATGTRDADIWYLEDEEVQGSVRAVLDTGEWPKVLQDDHHIHLNQWEDEGGA